MVVGFSEPAIPSLPANTPTGLRVEYINRLQCDRMDYFPFFQWMPQKSPLMISRAWGTSAQPAILESKRI